MNLDSELATAFFTDKICKVINRGEYTSAIYVDLSKAFDTISHGSLINKLPRFGINSVTQEWFASYLFARKQQVKYQGTLSTATSVFCVVPQESILGPLLFLVHFNDSITTLTTYQIVMYADHTVIYYLHKDLTEIENRLKGDFKSLTDWLGENETYIKHEERQN